MKTYSTQFRVEEAHLDKGNHMNWLAQLAIAQELHFQFREELGLGLEELQTKHNLFLVMGVVKDVTYRRQLRCGDIVDVEMTMSILSLTRLEFHCTFRIHGQTATEMSWVMPLVSGERPAKIPMWMTTIIN